MTRETGAQAETKALTYLQNNGLKLIAQNYYSRFGEIDLIMRHNDHLVFVEVRHRLQQSFGGALESITRNKQQKLRRTAQIYLIEHYQRQPPCRFDIVCLQGALQNPKFLWLKDAF